MLPACAVKAWQAANPLASRSIFDAIFSCLRARVARGATCQTTFHRGRRSFTISGVFAIPGIWTLLWRALHRAERERQGRHPDPSAKSGGFAIRVKTVEESSRTCGYDAHKHIKGRKRHLLVDTLGLPISICVTPANTHDTRGARCLLAGLKFFVPRLCKDLY
jgi:Transposase DDE domain